MPSPRENIASALADVATGDRAALRSVYDLTSRKLFGIILPVVRDREKAEDVLQDVFLKIWHRAGRYDAAKGSPVTWLCAIARNSAIDTVRRDGRNPEVADDAYLDATDDAPAAEDALCSAEDRQRLLRCLDGLREDHRQSIRMAYFGGYTYSELAEKREVPLGTVKSWIRRGLASLRGCLSDG